MTTCNNILQRKVDAMLEQEAGEPLWFAGVCDSLYRKVLLWRDHYDRGEISREEYEAIHRDLQTT